MCRDSRFAADGRPRAIGGDEKTRIQRVCVAQPRINATAIRRRVIVACGGKREVRHRRGSQIDAKLARFGRERVNQNPVLDHMGKGLAWLDLASESEKGRPYRIAKPAVGDRHVENRLGVGGNALPNAKRLEQPAHRGDDRGGAFVIGGRATAEAWVGDGNGEAIAECLAQSDGEREPGEAAAGNQDIEIRTRHGLALGTGIGAKPRDNRTAAATINSSLTDLLRADR
jgi:hypothetical protein